MGRATAGLHIGLGHGLDRGFRCGSAVCMRTVPIMPVMQCLLLQTVQGFMLFGRSFAPAG